MRYFLFGLTLTGAIGVCGQSVHQEQLEHYNALGILAEDYPDINDRQAISSPNRGGCSLTKTVYGWHPYWENGSEVNYQWNLLSHLSYFSYEVEASTGNAITTHGFQTANAVTEALNNGVKVTLCVTLFSSHSTFFASSTAQQTLIDNLITEVQNRGAHGVNIDFEGIPSSQSANFTAFMIDLANQMHTAIPGSEVSTVLYAVDWSDVFDEAALDPYLDQFIIMGYDYYWSGSTTSGPNDPLYHFGSTYNYTLSKTITYYLDEGVSNNKLVLGLPYYGREYTTTSSGIPSSVLTPPNSTTRTYTTVRDNVSGNYTSGNNYFDNESYSNYYEFNTGNWKQCFINSAYALGKRMDLILQQDIAGMGIWALGYDDGYTDYWNEIQNHFTDCSIAACSDTIYDLGGPNKDYYNNESFVQTIAPTGATGLTLAFNSFSVESGYDTLFIYDGPTTGSALIGAYTGSTSPGTIIATGNSLTLRWKSDIATVGAGWEAIWVCTTDIVPPTTSISPSNPWETQDFGITFTDNDDYAVDESFWQVIDLNGTEWRANETQGFFNDNFNGAMHASWTDSAGTWATSGGYMNQSDEAESNANLFTPLAQTNGYTYLYHWSAQMNGTGTNRRSGIHFFSDDASLPNRNNSYFVYFRVDNDRAQIYRVDSDVWGLKTDDPVTIDPGTWYDYKVTYNPVTGLIKAYVDDLLVSSWTDPVPYQTGAWLSLRSGGTNANYEDVKVYRSRGASETVTVGSPSEMVRYQNPNPTTPACKVNTIVVDGGNNWSAIATETVNIDWTPPTNVLVDDGAGSDIDTTYNNSQLEGNWTNSSDPNSGVANYWYAIGTTAGMTTVTGWTNNLSSTSALETGLSLIADTVYYFSVMVENGAGLFSDTVSSDGQLYLNLTEINEGLFPNELSIYPNPFNCCLTVQPLVSGNRYELKLLDATGKLITETSMTNEEVIFHYPSLEAGYYLLHINSGTQVQIVRLVKF